MNILNDAITYNELIQTIQGETAAESEIILPDYCPNILKLVKTEAIVFVRSQSVRGDRAFIEGAVEFKIVYISEDESGLQCIVHQTPFSYSTEIKNISDTSQIDSVCRISYANTRALSPQKLYVKSTIEAIINVFAPNTLTLLPEEKKMNVELKNKTCAISDVVSINQKILKISDQIEPDKNIPFGKLLRYEANFIETDQKLLNSKVIVKADMIFKIVYISSDNISVGTFDAKIPVSQVIETGETDENTVCNANFDLSDCKINVKENSDGRQIIEYDMDINISVECYSNENISMPVDAFSLKKEVECVGKTLKLQYLSPISENFDFREKIEITDVDNILDVAVSPTVLSVIFDNDTKNVVSQGVLNCNIMYRDQSGELLSSDKSLPFTIKTPVSDSPSSVKGNTRIVLTDVEYSCNGKELELHTMGRYKGNIIFQNDCYCVTDINEIKEKKEKLPQMVIYYAVKGDKVWDIAKKYAASPDTLIKNNNLQGDELTEDKMIYITR